MPSVDIESAWFRPPVDTNRIGRLVPLDPRPCDQVRVRGLMDCAHFAAKRYYANSFDYEAREKMCILYSSHKGRYEIDNERRVSDG